ncbi:MAG: adenosylcobinamide-GDP ribazoletransferase [Chloroflexota bacterium]
MKEQINLFFLALGFFSRIPMSAWVEYSPERQQRASRYIGLVGWLLGGLVVLTLFAAQSIFSTTISIWLAILVGLLLTGALHEDGLADLADAFGGGFTAEKKLAIMKDSRLGTYGAVAIVMALGGKFLLLSELSPIWPALLVAYPLSRAVAITFTFDMPYVSDSNQSKSQSFSNNQSMADLFILSISILPILSLLSLPSFVALLVTLLLFRFCFKRFLLRQIGGYTGDCLGAAQQLSELIVYSVLIFSPK